jgi:uncharacterized protein (DUF427 family)
MISEADHVEPAPRRIRATLGGEQIFDTTRARYVWEWPYYPQYYIPVEHIDQRFLVDEDHGQRLRQGNARRHGLRAGALDRPGTVRLFGDDAIDGVAGTARFEWNALDAWYEEDEQVFVHPRNPYVRVDALRSHRHVRASLDGITLAETGTQRKDRPRRRWSAAAQAQDPLLQIRFQSRPADAYRPAPAARAHSAANRSEPEHSSRLTTRNSCRSTVTTP